MDQEVRYAKSGSPHLPDWIFERKRENRQRPVDAGVVQIPPVGLRKKVDRFDVTNTFIGCDDKNIVEDESVRDGICIAYRDEQQTDYECARRGNMAIEQVHPTILWVIGLDRLNSAVRNRDECSSRIGPSLALAPWRSPYSPGSFRRSGP